MQKIIFLFAGFLFSTGLYAQNTADDILGQWTNEDKSRVMEFKKSGKKYEAYITEVADSTLIGKKQISALAYDRKNSYSDGVLHIIQKNKEADCSAKLLDENTLELKVKFGWVSKTAVWTKVSNQ